MSDQSKPALYALTPQAHATVLAALRLYQHELGIHTSYAHYDAIRTIASGDESWPRLTAKQIDPLCQNLNHNGLDIGEVVNILGADSDDPYVAAAQEKNLSDSVSFDGNPVVSQGEGGAQVMAWVWVPDTDPDRENEDEPQFRNHYRHCGQEWTDVWSCTCNDRCPVCNKEIEPYQSDDLAEETEQ